MEMVAVTVEQVDDNSSNTTAAGSEEPFFSNFVLAIKIATGLASGLSVFGAITVIVYQLFFRDKQFTVVRLIVIMLSAADFLVAVSHIWGATQNIQMFMEETTDDSSYADTQCTTQAVFAVFGSLSSSMWTLALVSCVFVMYCIKGIAVRCCQGRRVIVSVFAFYNFLCWGFPFLLVIVLGRLYHLGYAETADLGWCYISLLATEPNVEINEKLVLPLSYESWTWLIILIIAFCIVGYVIVFGYNRLRIKDDPQQPRGEAQGPPEDPSVTAAARLRADTFELLDHQANPGVVHVSWRPVLVGIFLLILRMPCAVIDSILFVHKPDHHKPWLGVVILIAAVGESLQGLVNSILFVWCRPHKIYQKVYACCCPCTRHLTTPARRDYEVVPGRNTHK